MAAVAANERFRAVSFESNVGTVHPTRASTTIHCSTTELPRTSHRFYIDKLLWEFATKTSRVCE